MKAAAEAIGRRIRTALVIGRRGRRISGEEIPEQTDRIGDVEQSVVVHVARVVAVERGWHPEEEVVQDVRAIGDVHLEVGVGVAPDEQVPARGRRHGRVLENDVIEDELLSADREGRDEGFRVGREDDDIRTDRDPISSDDLLVEVEHVPRVPEAPVDLDVDVSSQLRVAELDHLRPGEDELEVHAAEKDLVSAGSDDAGRFHPRYSFSPRAGRGALRGAGPRVRRGGAHGRIVVRQIHRHPRGLERSRPAAGRVQRVKESRPRRHVLEVEQDVLLRAADPSAERRDHSDDQMTPSVR